MHEHQPPVAGEDHGVLIGLIVIIAVQHDFRAQMRNRPHLDVGCGQRHDDERRDAAGAGGERHPLRMVARGRADHPALGTDRRELGDFVVSAAYFERKDRLEVFSLEENAIIEPAGQALRVVERRLDRDVVHFGLEYSFYVGFLHDGHLLGAPTIA